VEEESTKKDYTNEKKKTGKRGAGGPQAKK
jgi:hypothetical protein